MEVPLERLAEIAPEMTYEQLVLILREFGFVVVPILQERDCPFLQEAWERLAKGE